jgi:hypothetical protein
MNADLHMSEELKNTGEVRSDGAEGIACWSAELTPAFVRKAAQKDPSVQCADPSYKMKFKTISNNYVGLFLNKRVASKQLGPSSPEVTRDRQESRRRCLANGISAAHCPGA